MVQLSSSKETNHERIKTERTRKYGQEKREHAVKVMKEIVAGVRPDVIKNYEMPMLCNVQTGKETGFGLYQK